jgi:hypothetical protein
VCCNHRQCEGCGWNPKVQEARLKAMEG